MPRAQMPGIGPVRKPDDCLAPGKNCRFAIQELPSEILQSHFVISQNRVFISRSTGVILQDIIATWKCSFAIRHKTYVIWQNGLAKSQIKPVIWRIITAILQGMVVISHGSLVICRDGHVICGKVAAISQTGSANLAGMVFALHHG